MKAGSEAKLEIMTRLSPFGGNDHATHDTKTDRTRTEPIRLAKGEMIHVGIDVHKKTYHIALPQRAARSPDHLGPEAREPGGGSRVAKARSVSTSPASHVRGGPTGFEPARRLQAEKIPVKVVAASKLPVAAVDSKSDRLDCRKLALYSAKGLVHAVRIPTAQEEADRQILRIRDQMIRKARMVQQQIKQLPAATRPGIAEGTAVLVRASDRALRGLELLSKLRFCLDLLLDELGTPRSRSSGRRGGCGSYRGPSGIARRT